jgi:hypothetical protein
MRQYHVVVSSGLNQAELCSDRIDVFSFEYKKGIMSGKYLLLFVGSDTVKRTYPSLCRLLFVEILWDI